MKWQEGPATERVPVHELIGLIYDAAEDPELWPMLLAMLGDALDNIPLKTVPGSGSVKSSAPDPETSAATAGDVLARLQQLDGNELAQTLLPHFQRALRFNHRLAESQQIRERALGILEHLPLGVILADENAAIRSMNSQARELLELNDPLRLRNNRLVAASLPDTIALQDLIRTAVVCRNGGGTLRLNDTPAISLIVIPCADTPDEEIIQPCCTLFIAAPDLDRHLNTDLIRRLFALSHAEARLTQMLVRGRSVSQAATELNISTHTARSQLKAVFSKTGTRRQPELVQKVLTSPAILTRTRNGEPTRPTPRAPAAQLLRLRDGRRLCFAEHGDPDGTPVLFFHSIVGSRLQIHPDKKLIRTMGVRWIVPERPGFGRSDPLPGRTLLNWADDVSQLADHLGLERFHLAGFSTGGSHAAACAWRMPDRIIRTALISPMAPYSSLSSLSGMPPTNRMLMAMAHYTPTLLNPFMRVMLQGLIRHPEQITSRHIELWPEADRQLMTDAETREHMVEIFREAIRQGPDALVNEQLLLAHDWGFDPADIQGPVHLWHGDADIHVPPAMLTPLKRIVDLRLRLIPRRGHYLVLSHWREIFEELLAPTTPRAPTRA